MEPRTTWLAPLGLSVLALAVAPAAAQDGRGDEGGWRRQVYAFDVLDADGEAYEHPFLGGFNLPRPQLADIDGDGDLDLFVQEYSDDVMFFERVGEGDGARFVWRSDAFHDLAIGEWYHFYDLDGDGDLDLLGEKPFSHVRAYRNEGTPREPDFTDLGEVLTAEGEPLFSDRQNIPKLGDLDCDGRLDLLVGKVEGSVTRYEAQGAGEEAFNDAGVPVFTFVEDHFQDIEIIGQILGVPQGLRQGFDRRGAQGPDGLSLHGANTMALHDFDSDGDLDLFWGDFFEPGLLLIENRGSCRSPNMRGEPRPFPLNDPIETSGYNAPTFGDVDGDGDDDLVMGVLGGAFNPASTAIDNLWLLERTGGDRYEARTSQLLSMIDVGSESFPAFADVDADGDLDLFLGNKIEQHDPKTGKLYFFENVGSSTAPRLQLRGPMEELSGHYDFAPAFGDLDGDGDLDILLGTWDDELQLVTNEGTRESPSWTIADPEVVVLTRGRNATPTLGDVDGDGDLDLLVGESSGELNFWRNEGTPSSPDFQLVSDSYLDIDVGRRSAPHLADIDGDGDLDLLIGSETEGLALYRNQGSPTEPDFVRDEAFSVPVHPFATPVLADMDGDGVDELYAGGIGGGLDRFVRR